jgi:dimethylglycine dehydrogenase
VFGAAWGLEYPLWFAPTGMEPVEEVTFRRSNAHGPVGCEVRAVREAVGVIETTGYAKYAFSGPQAESFLNTVLTNRMPDTGRIVLAPMLNENGKLIGDFTVARLGPELFHVFGTGAAEDYHCRWWEAHMPPSGVTLHPLRDSMAGLSIAGPNARALLAAMSGEDVSNAAFPFMRYRRMELGMIPVTVGRLSFTGDLGYEIWVTQDRLATLYDLIWEHGAALGLRDVGLRALNAMRLEKNFGTWAREYRPIYGPFEAGLGRFVNFKKGDFIGREAALKEKETGGKLRLAALAIDASDADVVGDEPVRLGGKAIGWVTSGGYAHHVQASVALAYIPAEHAVAGATFHVEILDEMRPATLITEPLFDPSGARMRG